VFVVDFFCYRLLLAIELDGSVHNWSYQKERDNERTKVLEGFGITVIRFTNDEVENNVEKVIEVIEEKIKEQKKSSPTPSPSPLGEGNEPHPWPLPTRGGE